MRPGIIEQIEKTVKAHLEGHETKISLKLNSLVDQKCIKALYEASQAGVEIEINVRGICCLRPGVPGVSENIRVISIVGAFLEHSRVYAFRRGDENTVLIGSADLMPRNLDSRVELVTPVLDETARDQALDMLERCFADNVNSWVLDSSGSWSRLSPEGGEERDVHKELRERHLALAATTAPQLAG
jgi:polyphosphate kinase